MTKIIGIEADMDNGWLAIEFDAPVTILDPNASDEHTAAWVEGDAWFDGYWVQQISATKVAWLVLSSDTPDIVFNFHMIGQPQQLTAALPFETATPIFKRNY